MKVIHLEVENFKPIKAIQISPGNGPVVIGGRNDQGKSSVMDSIWVALKGRSMAPPKPIRAGEEECIIRLDVGDYKVQRKFTAKEGGTYTDSVKVVDDRDRVVQKPQQVLDGLLGAVGFDPFEFTRLRPEDQAEQLLQLVPLPIDLEAFAEEDSRDYATRRDRNRDAEALAAQIRGLPFHEDAPAEPVDRDAILAKLSSASDTNTAIDRERIRREGIERAIRETLGTADRLEGESNDLRRRANQLELEAKELRESNANVEREYHALPALDEPVDTAALRVDLQAAEAANAKLEANRRREELLRRQEALVAQAGDFTKAMEDRERQRREALQKAKMPVEGLGFSVNEKGKPVVTYRDLPFSQAGKAVQIKASTAIAMAANPELRILRITDGSLLDDDSLQIIAEMAADADFQLWVEVVGEGAAGIIIENGEIKDAAATGGDGAAAGHQGVKPGDKPTAAAGGAPTKSKKPAAGKATEGPLL